MSEWTWKQAVADEIVGFVNDNLTARFSLSDIYACEDNIQAKFPRNKNVRPKIRQTLQRLRDTGLVRFLGEGQYEVDFGFSDFELEPANKNERGIAFGKVSSVVRRVRLRNTLLATEIKRRYDYVCQICRNTVQLVNRKYAEAHHIRPLGSPHFGHDVEGNVLVVCPNHHVMLDRGAIMIDPERLMVSHVHGVFDPARLYIAPWHSLHQPSLKYYHRQIFGR